MLRYIVSKSGVWVRNSSGDETIARLFELKLITCLNDPRRPLRKVGATARGHYEARNKGIWVLTFARCSRGRLAAP